MGQIVGLMQFPSGEVLGQFGKKYSCDGLAILMGMHIVDIGSLFHNVMTPFLKAHKMSAGRYNLLGFLHRNKNQGYSPSDLAARANVTRATMTGLIDLMELEGHVKRRLAAHDRRFCLVFITPKGSRTIEMIRPKLYPAITKALGKMSKAEKQMFLKTISKANLSLRTHISKKAGDESF